MHRDELIALLQDEADRALVILWPRVVGFLERNFVLGEKVIVPMDLNAWPRNIQQTILGTAVKRLEELGYKAHSNYNDEGNPCLEVE